MTLASSHPCLFPEPVPGGSLIGSVNSRFAATFALYQSDHPQGTETVVSRVPTCNSKERDHEPAHPRPRQDPEIVDVIYSLSRPKIEALVTQAWIRNIPNQSEEKLRDLVGGAVEKGLLNQNDIYSTFNNSFDSLPTEVLPLTHTFIV